MLVVSQSAFTCSNFNNGNTKSLFEICSKLIKKTPERRSGVFFINFKQVSHNDMMFPLLTLNKEMPAGFPHNSSVILHNKNQWKN